MSKQSNIPQLRFKGFDGEWLNEKLLQHVNSISSGKIKPTDEGDFLVYGSTGVIGKSNIYSHDGDYILVARVGANAGQINRAKGKYSVTDNTLVVDLKKNINVSFCESFLRKYNLNKLIFGSGQPLITGGLLKSIDFIFPTLPEQEKIASFLSAVDEKTQQLTRKAALLEQYKKGVMQQLFSGKLRFKDEENNFRKGKLGDFGFFYYGKGAPKTSIFKDAKTPCVRYGELYSTYKEEIKEIKSYTNVNPKELKLSKGGEVLVPRVGEDPRDFANCSYLPFPNVAIGEMISVYNTKEDGLFMTYYINAMLKKQLAKLVEGGNVSNLYFRYVETIEVEIPSLKVQQKTVEFLKSIDEKIGVVQGELLKMQEFKKGLLQQMFV